MSFEEITTHNHHLQLGVKACSPKSTVFQVEAISAEVYIDGVCQNRAPLSSRICRLKFDIQTLLLFLTSTFTPIDPYLCFHDLRYQAEAPICPPPNSKSKHQTRTRLMLQKPTPMAPRITIDAAATITFGIIGTIVAMLAIVVAVRIAYRSSAVGKSDRSHPVNFLITILTK